MNIKTLKLEGRKSWSLLTGINREIIPRQVTKLAESINKIGIIRPVIVCTVAFITGKPTTYILDGQHLFHACIRNKVNVPYVEVTVKDMQELVEVIALLNSSSKSWVTADYVLAWSSINGDYKKLMHYINTYPLDVRLIATILAGNKRDGGGMSTAIKKGLFKIYNEATAEQHLDTITRLLKVIKFPKKEVGKEFIIQFNNYFSKVKVGFNIGKFIEYCEKNRLKFCNTANPEEINGLFYKFQRF